MSIWGKLLGGAAGFAVGGPLGALVGAVAGHAIDRWNARPGPEPEGRRVAFTVAVIVLGAKMAKADGQVTKDEIAAFKRVFRIPREEQANVARLFNQARSDPTGYEPYARQIAEIFRATPAVLEELLEALFVIAASDRAVTPPEIDYLKHVAALLGVSDPAFQRLRARYAHDARPDPYVLLGLSRGASDDEVKAAYRKLVRENHPDRLTAEGMPPEFVQIANDKLATINAAYDQVARQRGLR